MIRPKILIIDDDHSITNMLEFLLESRGYDVSSAHDSLTGIGIACKNTPDLILLDYGLPDKNGLDFLKHIREFEDLRDTPVIMITARGMKEIIKKSLQLGVVDFIVKPFEIESLVERIDNWAPLSDS